MGNVIIELAEEKGEERGIKIGEERGKESTALRMLDKGYSIEEVSEITGVAPERLEGLRLT